MARSSEQDQAQTAFTGDRVRSETRPADGSVPHDERIYEDAFTRGECDRFRSASMAAYFATPPIAYVLI